MNNRAIAHVKQIDEEQYAEHWLEDHLAEVAKLSSGFASGFGSEDWAYLAGLWHDLGKYSKEFQTYIKSASGYDPEAHIETSPNKVNHSSAGAIYAVDRLDVHGRILAYLIAGHHAGLPDCESGDSLPINDLYTGMENS